MNELRVERGHFPDGWAQLVIADVHLAVRRPPDDPLLDRLRQAAGAGPDPGAESGLDPLLDALVEQGVRRLPDFVAVHATERRVVARGAACADVQGPGTTALVRAAPRQVWADVVVDVSAERVVLSGESGNQPEPAPAAELVSESGADREPDPEPAAGPDRRDDAPRAGATAAELTGPPPSYDHLFGATQHGRPPWPEPVDDSDDSGASSTDERPS
ncbi:MAG TPA: hypothetical protein VFJ12_03115, partial [Segeticoccus sp.]|nr:hypothetical protein [Segeticoccus sp.]